MKLTQESSVGVVLIDAYDTGSVTVAGDVRRRSLLVTPDAGVLDWDVADFSTLSSAALDALVALRPAVVLIGTGARQRFPAPAVLRPLIEARIGFEVMDTGSACRTYNLLAAERRKVVAALIVETTSV